MECAAESNDEVDLEGCDEIAWIKSVFDDYDISWNHGFSPEYQPLLQFSDPYFSIWDDIFFNITSLIKTGGLHTAVQNMPLLDHNKLTCREEWCRGYLVLSAIGGGYVWQNGEENPPACLPKSLAIPWVAVASHLGIRPIMTHFCFALLNWKILDKTRPLNVSNVDTQFSFTGHKGEHWFAMITLQVELDAVPGIRSVVAAQKAVRHNNPGLLKTSLIILRKCIAKLEHTLKRMHERLDPEFFYTRLRTYLSGWQNIKTLPDGIVYEGVQSQPMKYSGGSAAQSTIFQTFDAVLGVTHNKVEDGEPSFLETMLDYMPRPHREFILSIRAGPSVRQYVKANADNDLTELFNACTQSLVQFRSTHIQLVTRYITIQAAKKRNTNLKMLAEQGTGGTAIMPFLKAIRKETSDAKIS